MAETVTIAGKKIPKPVLYVAGAGTVGFVGYAWWTRGRDDFAAEQAAIDEALPSPVAEPTDEPGFGLTGTTPPKTNAEWNETAVTKLMNIGIDAIAAQAAIGKFLARRSLTTAEAALVEQAIAAAGYPPENGPWVILRDAIPGPIVPGPPGGLSAPSGLRAIFLRWNGNTPIYRIAWNPVSGAKDYGIRHINLATGGNTGTSFRATTSADTAGSAPGKVDAWEVAARGADNKLSAFARLTFTAASKTAAGKPGISASFGLINPRPSAFGLSFKPVPGATSYRYRWIINGRGGPWASTTKTSFGVTWRTGKGKRVQAGVVAVNKAGTGGERRSNTVISK